MNTRIQQKKIKARGGREEHTQPPTNGTRRKGLCGAMNFFRERERTNRYFYANPRSVECPGRYTTDLIRVAGTNLRARVAVCESISVGHAVHFKLTK